MSDLPVAPGPQDAKAVTEVNELNFDNLGLGERSIAAIKSKGFEIPTKIQAEVIPLILETSHDVVAQSQTGTGKTAAFGLPMLERLDAARGPVQALVLVPTRELAVQVAEELNSLKGANKLSIVPVYGGQGYDLQLRHLRQGVDILVGTPGRLIDHLQRGSLKLDQVKYVVLDEADEMLDMGFIDDIEAILGTCSTQRRMLLFSATMPDRIRQMADTWMKDVKHVTIRTKASAVSLTEQSYVEVLERDKFEALCRIIDHAEEFYGMVFCRTKVETDNLCSRLMERGYGAEALHGDINQNMREKVLEAFRKRVSEILVATDVAARGIDVEGLTHVINYHLPNDPESYVHRIGRTGRAGREGVAITFVNPQEFRKLQFIQKHARGDIRRDKLPSVDDIMTQKKNRLVRDIQKYLDQTDEEHNSLEHLASELLALAGDTPNAALKVTAAILRHQLTDYFDEGRYSSITDLSVRGARDSRDNRGGNERGRFERNDFGAGSGSDDRSNSSHFAAAAAAAGRARLYISRGKADGFSKPGLVKAICSCSGLRDRDIDNVEVFEFFSFATVDLNLAERVISSLQDNMGKQNGKPVARFADGGSGGGGNGGVGGADGGGRRPFKKGPPRPGFKSGGDRPNKPPFRRK